MVQLAYVLSASHSGSTLLAMLLGAHPEACTVGELKAGSLGDPQMYRCSCGQKIEECDFWIRVRQSMRRKGFEDFQITRAGTSIHELPSPFARRLLAPLYRGGWMELVRDAALSFSSEWRQHLKQTQTRTSALTQTLHELTGAKVIVDSSKVALRLKYLLQNPKLQIKVIRLIRDGRAVAMTYTDEWRFADAADPTMRGGGSGQRHPPVRQNMADAAREWRRSNEAADCLVHRLPASQWTRVHYEQLCREPGATLKALCHFLEIDPTKINMDFRSRRQHVIGNGMRLDSTSEIRLDERWRSHLSPVDISAFEAVAGNLNRRCGYV